MDNIHVTLTAITRYYIISKLTPVANKIFSSVFSTAFFVNLAGAAAPTKPYFLVQSEFFTYCTNVIKKINLSFSLFVFMTSSSSLHICARELRHRCWKLTLVKICNNKCVETAQKTLSSKFN